MTSAKIFKWDMKSTNHKRINRHVDTINIKLLQSQDTIENATNQNMWDEAKTVLIGKFVAQIREEGKSQIIDSSAQLRNLEKERKNNLK